MASNVSDDQRHRLDEKDDADYEVILAEFESFIRKPKEEQLQELMQHPWEALSSPKTPNGSTLFASPPAHDRFVQIAKRGLKHLGVAAKRHRLEVILPRLQEEFVSRLIAKADINPQNAHSVFEAAVAKAEASYEALTFYVPCSVVAHRACDRFSIGPVTFVIRESFLREHETAIRESATTENLTFTNILLERTNTFYTEFQWIACLSVPACDRQIAKKRALAGVQKALDVFKLVVGGERAAHVKQGYDSRVPEAHAELVSKASGEFSILLGGKMQDAVVNDDWYAQVISAPFWPLIQSVLFSWWNNWDHAEEIEVRFLDALAWHSDAISEHEAGAKIVKFWTAIERILSAVHGSIAPRAAVLCAEPGAFLAKEQQFSGLYQKRSDVVHGGSNRSDEAWYAEAARASEEAARGVLFQYLYYMPTIRRSRMATTKKKLQSWINGLDNLAKRERASNKLKLPRGG
jgi:hypothetical protein